MDAGSWCAKGCRLLSEQCAWSRELLAPYGPCRPDQPFSCLPRARMSASVVPELLAKKERRNAQWAAEKAQAQLEARKTARASRKVIFKRAESYVKEYRAQVRGHTAQPPRPRPLPHACSKLDIAGGGLGAVEARGKGPEWLLRPRGS